MDFFRIGQRNLKSGRKGDNRPVIELYPEFVVCRSKDLMVRGRAFYGIWDEEKGLWSTDEYDVVRLVDKALYARKDELANELGVDVIIKVRSLSNFSSKSWIDFRNYLSKVSDTNHQLDDRLTFLDTPVKRSDYVSKRLGYPLEPGSIEAYEEIMSTLYNEEERAKLEWAIGSIIAGDAKSIQKFVVLYGEAGSGKSTILNLIERLFDGYWVPFDAKALTSASNSFATEAFRTNPLVAIQHDGDLSKIEDNTKLNSVVSHEHIVMNEKFKPSYSARCNAFLLLGTNRPVKITEAKSGIIRRLIDVTPSGRKLATDRYFTLIARLEFELGAIAHHCLGVYNAMGKNYYASYRPISMIFKTDVFFNFVESYYDVFKAEDGVTLKRAYDMYKEYCADSLVEYKLAKYKFRDELHNYFKEFKDQVRLDGAMARNYYSGFLAEKFETYRIAREDPRAQLLLDASHSLLDDLYPDAVAQYASDKEIPQQKWRDVTTTLKDLDTRRLHYVKLPKNHIVIDFDLKDAEGNKSAERNLDAASKWPPTYAEYSKGGGGIHLHYRYDGDTERLKNLYSDGIEIKVFTGDAAIRRKVTKCNHTPVATISGGLPMKGEKMVDLESVKSERALRALITRNLKKEIHPGTKPSVDFIKKILDDAHASGLKYDVSDMRSRILAFAAGSTNQAEYCVKLVGKMKFRSEEEMPGNDGEAGDKLVFFDVEVFPNLFLVNWKVEGRDAQCVRMVNPTAADVEELMKFRLVGFNCRRYDNHILYGRYLGYSNEELYRLSQRIVTGQPGALFGEAYNISYTDVYDFSSKKQSLKKFEIELGIPHRELGLPWDEPVPEDKWLQVAEYCDNDVRATEAVFHARKPDWIARQILANMAGLTVNDTTNSLTTRIIFGGEKNPQLQFRYRHMGLVDGTQWLEYPYGEADRSTAFQGNLPIFPGYQFEGGKSTYRGEEVGEGGYVYAEPGIHFDVAVLDVASMHPSTIVAETLFGEEYTRRFKDILDARIAIKHGDLDRARTMLDGKLAPYLTDDAAAGGVAGALKIAINSVYGLTSAGFANPFRDPRNKDNIVAKRGALFMINLKHEVQSRGFTVAHIKTDSIKIPHATSEIIQFVMEYGKRYGYTFEHEATYERMCLVNDAVFVAKYRWAEKEKLIGQWTSVGTQFIRPYVFKTLFSHEPIEFHDMCETKSVTTALYLDMNESLPDGEHDYRFVGRCGSFCPIKPGHGGGLLVREKEGKYYAATGTKGYRWLEAEMVETLRMQDAIDTRYYETLASDAIRDISKYGDFASFVSGDRPPWIAPCGTQQGGGCLSCDDHREGWCQKGYIMDEQTQP